MPVTSSWGYVIQPLDLNEALAAILDDIVTVAESDEVEYTQALGRVAAEDVNAPVSLPPFRASAMDGYALRSADALSGRPLRCVGISSAGHPCDDPVPTGACIRIFTGAAVPDALDAVVLQEDCRRAGDLISIDAEVSVGDHVRPAGHDIERGSRLLDAGTCIGPFELAWLAACGVTSIAVRRRPRVAIFSTGDELVEPGGHIGAGQIFDANRHALRALLGSLPIELEDLGILEDSAAAIHRALSAAAQAFDAIFTTGGVSVGDADHVRGVVDRIGRVTLWRLNLKPGKPLAYGRLGRAIFIGLPGNPVSALVTAILLGRPALLKLCGAIPRGPLAIAATLSGHIRHRPGREEYQRGTLSGLPEHPVVRVAEDQSSNRIGGFVTGNCLVRVPKDAGDLVAGSSVTVLPFSAMI